MSQTWWTDSQQLLCVKKICCIQPALIQVYKFCCQWYFQPLFSGKSPNSLYFLWSVLLITLSIMEVPSVFCRQHKCLLIGVTLTSFSCQKIQHETPDSYHMTIPPFPPSFSGSFLNHTVLTITYLLNWLSQMNLIPTFPSLNSISISWLYSEFIKTERLSQ